MKFDKYLELNRKGLADFHAHTCYCDGNNTPEEMVRSAAEKGLAAFGLSGHGYTTYDESYCMLSEDEVSYESEIRRLSAEYDGRLEVLCGVEQDALAGRPTRGWDYVIGSVHYIDIRGQIAAAEAAGAEAPDWLGAYPEGIVPIDESREIWIDIVSRYFDGDVYNMIELFYETAAAVVEQTGADIIGHLDLITKYNRGGEGGARGELFDEGHPRYITAWQKAADRLLESGALFEINTGGMSRGYRTDAYPARPIRDYIAANGGSFILSSDSHNTETLCSRFSDYSAYLK